LISDPNNSISFNTGTQDEMLFDAFVFVKYQNGDENVSLDSLLQGDTIFSDGSSPKPIEPVRTVVSGLSLGIDSFNDKSIENQIVVSPNPANNILIINLASASIYTAELLSVTGQIIIQTDEFDIRTSIDLIDIPDGMYILKVKDNTSGISLCSKVVVAH
jgi:hypothetical protein